MTNHDELREFGKLISSMPLSRSISEIEAAGEWIIALLDEIKELREYNATYKGDYARACTEIAQLRAEIEQAKKDAENYVNLVKHFNAALSTEEKKSCPAPKFDNVFCSNCGQEFGPGDHGFSHCENHAHLKPKR